MSSLQWAQKPTATPRKKQVVVEEEEEVDEPEVEKPEPPAREDGGKEEEEEEANEAELKNARSTVADGDDGEAEVDMRLETPVPNPEVETDQAHQDDDEAKETPKRKSTTKRKIPEPADDDDAGEPDKEGQEEEEEELGEEHLAYESGMDGESRPRRRKPKSSPSKRRGGGGGRGRGSTAKRRSSRTEDENEEEDADAGAGGEEDESKTKSKTKSKSRTKSKTKPRARSKGKPRSRAKDKSRSSKDQEPDAEMEEEEQDASAEEEPNPRGKRSRKSPAAHRKRARTMEEDQEDHSGLDKVEIPSPSDEEIRLRFLQQQQLQIARMNASGLSGNCFMGMRALLTAEQKASAERAMNGADRERVKLFLSSFYVDVAPEEVLNPWDTLGVRSVADASRSVGSGSGMCTIPALDQSCGAMDGFNAANEQPAVRTIPAFMERIHTALTGKKSRILVEGHIAGSMYTTVVPNIRGKVSSVHPDPRKGWRSTSVADYCVNGYRVVNYSTCVKSVEEVATHAMLCWMEATFADRPIMRWIRLDDARSQQLIHNNTKSFRAQFKEHIGEEVDRVFSWYKKVPLKSSATKEDMEEEEDVKPMQHCHRILSDTLSNCCSSVTGYANLCDRFASWCVRNEEEKPSASEFGGFGTACLFNGKSTKGSPVLDKLLYLNGVGHPHHMASMSQFYHDVSQIQQTVRDKALAIMAQKEVPVSLSASLAQDLKIPAPRPLASLGRRISSPTSSSSSSSSSAAPSGANGENGASNLEELLPEPVYGTPQAPFIRPGSCPKDNVIKTPKFSEATKWTTRLDIVQLFSFLVRVKKLTLTEEAVLHEVLYGVALSTLTLKIDHVPDRKHPSPGNPAEELIGGLEVMSCPPWWWIFFAAVAPLFPDVVRQSDPKNPTKMTRSSRKLPSEAKTLHEAMEHTGPLFWQFSKTNEDAFLDTVSSLARYVLSEKYLQESNFNAEEWEKWFSYGRKAGVEHTQDVDPKLMAKAVIKCKNLMTKFPWLWPPFTLVMTKPVAPFLMAGDDIVWSGLIPYRWRKNNSPKGLVMFLPNTLRRGQPSLSADSEWPWFPFFDPHVRKEQFAQGFVDTPVEGSSEMASFWASQPDQQPTIGPRTDYVVVEDLVLQSMHGPHGREIFKSQVPEIMQRHGFVELPSSCYTSISDPGEPTLHPFSFAPVGVNPVDGKRVPWSNARNSVLHGKSSPMKDIPYMRGKQADSLIDILTGQVDQKTDKKAATSSSKKKSSSSSKEEEEKKSVDAVSIPDKKEAVVIVKHPAELKKTQEKGKNDPKAEVPSKSQSGGKKAQEEEDTGVQAKAIDPPAPKSKPEAKAKTTPVPPASMSIKTQKNKKVETEEEDPKLQAKAVDPPAPKPKSETKAKTAPVPPASMPIKAQKNKKAETEVLVNHPVEPEIKAKPPRPSEVVEEGESPQNGPPPKAVVKKRPPPAVTRMEEEEKKERPAGSKSDVAPKMKDPKPNPNPPLPHKAEAVPAPRTENKNLTPSASPPKKKTMEEPPVAKKKTMEELPVPKKSTTPSSQSEVSVPKNSAAKENGQHATIASLSPVHPENQENGEERQLDESDQAAILAELDESDQAAIRAELEVSFE